MKKSWNRWTPERVAEFRRLYTARIKRAYKAGIHSCTRIGFKLALKRSDAVRSLIGRILVEARLAVKRPWTPEEDRILKRLYPTTRAADIQKQLVRTLPQIYRRARQFHLKPLTVRGGLTGEVGKEYRFKKGLVPANKGVRNWQRTHLSREALTNVRRTQFKPGHKSENTLHDGAVAVRVRWKRGGRRRKFIRIGPMNWIELKNHIWEKHHGKVPKGKCVAFRDLNLLDKDGCPKCVISNLILVDRAENARHGMLQSDRYVASRMAMKGTKGIRGLKGVYIDHNLMRLILRNPALVNAKRRQLNLKRRIDEREALPSNGRKQLPVQRRAV